MCSYITLKQATVVNMHIQIEDCSLVTTLKCISLVGTTSFYLLEFNYIKFGLTINQILWLTWQNA